MAYWHHLASVAQDHVPEPGPRPDSQAEFPGQVPDPEPADPFSGMGPLARAPTLKTRFADCPDAVCSPPVALFGWLWLVP